MSGKSVRARPFALFCEGLMALCVVIAFVSTIVRSVRDGYLVQPFIYNTFDTHMDWFNTAWWGAHDAGAGAYEIWQSIYPPISFIFLRMVTLTHCYVGDSIHARDCDWVGLYSLYTITFIDIVLVGYTYWRFDRRTALFRTTAITLGYPLLYAWERGNLILVCFFFHFLAFAPLLKSSRLKWFSAAIAINFKVYLISTMAVAFAKRRWLAMEVTTVLVGLVYFFTYALYGKGLPQEIVENIVNFAAVAKTHSWQDVYFATSLNSLVTLLADTPSTLRFVDSDVVEWTLLLVPQVVRLGQLSCVAAVFATWIRPNSAPVTRLAAISVSLAIMTSESGGYCYLLVLAFVFFERWEGPLRITALVCAYILSLTADYVVTYVLYLNQYSYWANHDVLSKFGIAIGHFLRPVVLIVMVGCLNALTIRNCLAIVRRDLALGKPIFPHLSRNAPALRQV